MNRILLFFSIAVFSIFLGSQITEGFLLVPYWKMLSKMEFYEYYSKFGPIIGTFYTTLTIIAVLIPVSFGIYFIFKKSRASKYAVVSSFFAFFLIVIFYLYFKGINRQFYEAAFDADQLKQVLETWEYMHWIRVFVEILSLVFLILAINVWSTNRRTIGA